MACCVPVAYAGMMPDEFKNFGQSLVGTALFSNNILLAMKSDYWSVASEYKPLLHNVPPAVYAGLIGLTFVLVWLT